MADIIAKKTVNGKVLTQRFSESAWRLLGKEKSGWKTASEQPIENAVISKTVKPSTGQKKEQVIENKVPAQAEQVIENKTEAPPLESVKENFMKQIEGFNKGTIKDFFDQQDPSVSYDNKATLPNLKTQLAEYLNYDIIKLQTAFT